MAESSQRLSDTLKASYPQVDWRRLSGFRNVLVHDYLGIDLKTVWRLVETELPILRDRVKEILRDLDKNPEA